ncbi:hypothetical protein [Tenacibaculum ovolyticum]|uniref:hypothetical protein n=1 Tax=Tenacibaculum ovolyticum TaxID=104270 RepID=UPI0003FE48C1|nr:hypothetical protein [Tenacibaculum ovolyticum]
MKGSILIISFLTLFSLNYCYSQGNDSIFYSKNKKNLNKIKFIDKSEFSKNAGKGFKFSEDYYKKYNKQSINDIRKIAKEYPNLIKVYSKDSIEITGLNNKELIKNYKSLTNDRDFQFFEAYTIEGNLVFDITSYEQGHTIMLNINSCVISVYSSSPMFLNKNEVISLNHYYGEDEFEYNNFERKTYFYFSLNNREIENYYLFEEVVYFKVLCYSPKQITYFKVDLNKLKN